MSGKGSNSEATGSLQSFHPALEAATQFTGFLLESSWNLPDKNHFNSQIIFVLKINLVNLKKKIH
jgi:hypothetical protein